MAEGGPGSICIRGKNVLQPPILITEDAYLIEFRDGFKELNALMVRIFNDDTWGLVTKNDEDWHATLIRYGYLDVVKSTEDIILQGL